MKISFSDLSYKNLFIQSIKSMVRDFSLSTLIASLVIVLVGMTSSAVLVFEAAKKLGATSEVASSWMGSICIALGLLTLIFSLRYKVPVLFAWSTPGAALLVSSLGDTAYSSAIGAFLFSAFLIFISGVTGFFEKIMNRIPMGLASALLAGVLLHFALDAFAVFKHEPLLVGLMFMTYLISKRFCPKFCMMNVLVVAVLVSLNHGLLQFTDVEMRMITPHFVWPTFSLSAILGIGFPLFIVTMASQNLTGIAVMRANDVHVPVSPLLTWSGAINFLIAPFGGFALNLAAITAAIGMGPEAHKDPAKRYMTGVISGVIYIFIGLAAGTVASLFAAFPTAMITALVGLALLSTIASSLRSALESSKDRDSSFIAFIVTASGLSLFGVGSAFWGLMAGVLAHFILSYRQNLK
jgi:benzoate membrane transport protein